MTAIAIDFMGSGSVDIYSKTLTERPAIVSAMPSWYPPTVPWQHIAMPIKLTATSSMRRMAQSDIDELDRAMFASMEFLYDLDE